MSNIVLKFQWDNLYRGLKVCAKFAILHQHFITALHGMQTRSSDEKAVCLSVRLSVGLSNAWIVTKRKKDLSRFLHPTKDHL